MWCKGYTYFNLPMKRELFIELCRAVLRTKGTPVKNTPHPHFYENKPSFNLLEYKDDVIAIVGAEDNLSLCIIKLENSNPVVYVDEFGKTFRSHGEQRKLFSHIECILFPEKEYNSKEPVDRNSELWKSFEENISHILDDKKDQDDEEIRNFYFDVMCTIAEMHNEEQKKAIIKKIEKLYNKSQNGNSRWKDSYEEANHTSQSEMEGYMWAINDVMLLLKTDENED